jgi:hypothetical protein
LPKAIVETVIGTVTTCSPFSLEGSPAEPASSERTVAVSCAPR